MPCASGTEARNPRREAAQRQEHEQQAKKVEQERELEAAVMRREIRIGMTPDQVLRAWGNPSRQQVTERASQSTQIWYWRCANRSQGSNSITFKNGVAATIRTACG